MKKYIKSVLKKGMVIKNYKEMCNLLDEPIKDGNSKKAQIKEWGRYFRYEKDGHKFVVKEVYDKPLPKNDLRSNGNSRKFPVEFKIPIEKENSIGVYKITLDDNIYIGSTTLSFRRRFWNHKTDSLIPATMHMLNNGGSFDVIEYMDGKEEIDIRKKENYYINLYRSNCKYNVINQNKPHLHLEKNILKKPRYKIIYVQESCFDFLLNIIKRFKLEDKVRVK